MTAYVVRNKDEKEIARLHGDDYAEALGKAARLAAVKDALASGGYTMVSVNDPGGSDSEPLLDPPKAEAQTEVTVRQIEGPDATPETTTAAEPVKFKKNQPVKLPDGRSGKVTVTKLAHVSVMPDGEDSSVKLLKTELAEANKS